MRGWCSSVACRLLLGAACSLALGCSSGLIPTRGPSAAEVAELERQIVELKKQATVGRVEVARLEREVARLQAELAQARGTSSPRQPFADREASVADPGPVPVAVEPEIEEMDVEVPPVSSAALEAKPDVAVAPVAVVEPLPTPAQAQRLYDEAYTLFHQQSYREAEARFQRYVDLYPRTELADNALFWIGESRYARGDFTSALEAFSDTVERFPQGNKVGDALLKAGKCLEALGDPEQALATYEEVTRRYPGSAASAQAYERLEVLRRR